MKKFKKSKKTGKIAAVIACRAFSTRLFAKPLQLVGNYTILELLIEQLKKSKQIDEFVLAIADTPGSDLFIDFAKKNNLKYVIGDEVDVLERLIHGAKKVSANVIFRTTSENPFIFWEGIDNLITEHYQKNADLSFYGNLPLGCSYEIINLDSLEYSHKYGKKKHKSEYSSLYIFENPKKFKIHRSIPQKNLRYPSYRLTVDTPEDLIVVRKIHEKLGKNKTPIPLVKIVSFLNSHKAILKINSKITLKYTRHAK